MGGDQGHAHAHQNGSAGRCHDAVGGRGRHAHAQDDAAEHGQEQRDQHAVARQNHNAVDDDVGKARHGDGARDDARDAAGGGHGNGPLTAGGQGLQNAHGGNAGFPAEQRYKNAGHDGQSGGVLNALLAGADQVDQQRQGEQKIALFQQGQKLRQLLPGQAPQPQLLCLQMNGNEDAREVQQSRQHGLQGDLSVGNLNIIRHQEGGSAHNGRHDLPTGGGGGLRGPGKFRLIARFLHQGNGHGAGTHRIGHGGAGYHALQGAGHNGHLGRAAGKSANQSVGDLDKVIRNARALQKRAEDDENDDELGADVNGGGQHALLAVEKIPDGIVHPAPEGGVGQAHGQGVYQKAPRHDQNGQAHASAADLRQSQHAHNADDDLVIGKKASLLDDGLGVEGIVQERSRAQDHQQNIIPGNVIHPLAALPGREHQIAQKHDPGHEGGQPQLLQPAGKQRHIQAEEGKQGQNYVYNDPWRSFPDPDIGLPVVLFHHGVQIHGFFCLFLLKQAHCDYLLNMGCGSAEEITLSRDFFGVPGTFWIFPRLP